MQRILSSSVRNALLLILIQAGLLLAPTVRAAVTFSVTPSTVSNTYAGTISLQITGLTDGETVVVQKFLDLNGNGVIDASDLLVQQFQLTDGQAGQVIGSVTNFNVPGDSNPATGAITATLNFQNGDFIQKVVGKYLYKLSSPVNGFTAQTNQFAVTNYAFAQRFTGNVISNTVGPTLPDAVVLLFPAPRPGHNGPGGDPLAGTVADNAGNYSIPAPAGTYTLTSFKHGYVVNFGAAPVLTLTAGKTVATNLSLNNTSSTISGNVVDAVNSAIGLPGVMVVAQSSGGLLTITMSDTNGSFSAPVSAGGWSIQALDQSLIVHGYVGPNGGVTATAGQTGVSCTVSQATALFYGTVADNLGDPLQGVDVSDSDNNNIYQSDAWSDASGNYVVAALGGLSSDSWQVSVNNSDGDPAYSGYLYSQPDFDTTGGDPLSVGQAAQVNFTAFVATNTISGYLTNASGNPIPNVGIYAYATINGVSYNPSSVNTDANGHYTLSVLNGTWSVGVNTGSGNDNLPGTYLAPPNQTVMISNNNATVDFTAFLAPYTISGYLTNNSGQPIANVGIYANPQNSQNYNLNENTDNNGFYSIGVTNGTWSVGVNSCSDCGGDSLPGNYLAPPNQTVVISGANGTADFTALPANNLITGNVQANGTNIVGVGVFANATINNMNYSQFVDTDANGNYSLNVANGSWNINVNCSGGGNGNDNLDYILGNGNYSCPNGLSVTISGSNSNNNNFIVQPAFSSPLQVTTGSLPSATQNVFYSTTLNASGGQPSYTWTLSPSSAALPPNLSLSPGGVLSGIPTNTGNYFFSVRVTDSSSATADQPLSLAVNSPGQLQITTTSLPSAVQNLFYTNTLLASGGQPPYVWSLTTNSAALPSGLTLATNGAISGIPATNGSNFFTVLVTDALDDTTTQGLSLIVVAPLGSLQVSLSPVEAVNAGAGWQLDASGTFHNSGDIVTNLSTGAHALSFKPISGWDTPSNQMVIITNGAATTAAGMYILVEKGNPTVVITSPKAGQSVSNSSFVLTGTTRDKVPVESVYYQLNADGWALATPINLWTNWTANLTLAPGSNSVRVYAVDISARVSATNKVAFKFIPSAILLVQTNGVGKVTPNDGGKLLALGANYTLVAAPIGNNLFSNWVGGTFLPYAVLSTNASYKFAMQSNLVLQANFVPNPFIPELGTFDGLFLDTNDVTEASSGFFTLALMSSGAFTGKITLPGGPFGFAQKFDVGGQVQFTIPAKPNPITLNLQLNLSGPDSEQITGTVSDGLWTAGLTADRVVFSATTNKATDYQGPYTLSLAGSQDPSNGPAGDGWATLTVSSAGAISMNGSLADGATISQTTASVSKDGRWPFYAPYVTPPTLKTGTVFGWINFSNAPASALGGTLYWFRPAGKTPAVYTNGFTNLAVLVTGSAYNPTNKPLLALSAGQVTLDGGNLPEAITNQILLASNNAISSPGNTNKLVLTINQKSGAISGTFANPSKPAQSIAVKGVLLQNQTNAAGYFLGANQSGTFLLENQ